MLCFPEWKSGGSLASDERSGWLGTNPAPVRKEVSVNTKVGPRAVAKRPQASELPAWAGFPQLTHLTRNQWSPQCGQVS